MRNNTQAGIRVRSGKGTVTGVEPDVDFTDVIDTIARVPRKHARWESVRYKGKRYQLFGGVRVPWFIDLMNPIKGKHA
jgi:hypothetical protein